MTSQTVFVCDDADDIERGTMRSVAVDERNSVLVMRTAAGELRATSARCTHFGAPLVKGVLCADRVLCPFHNAAFNVATGDIEDAPGLDPLRTFPVLVDPRTRAVTITVPDPYDGSRRTRQVPQAAPAGAPRTAVVVGAGAAGMSAAEELRMAGFAGRVVLIGAEPHAPYDRTKMSKALVTNPDNYTLRSAGYLAARNIEVRLSTTVEELDADNKTVRIAGDPETLSYDLALVATGGRPRKLDAPGADLGNIFYIRTMADAQALAARLGDTERPVERAVVVGSSFIGLEAASFLCMSQKIGDVTVVGPDKVPLERALGREVGEVVQDLHTSKGIKFALGTTVAKFLPAKDGASVGSAVLANGETLPADIVIVGIGVTLATDFVKGGKSVKVAKNGAIAVDDKFCAGNGLYAAGDVAQFPLFLTRGKPARIEHWAVALQQGRVAGRNMAAAAIGASGEAFATVPFFWSMQFGTSMRHSGFAQGWTEVVVAGDRQARKFAAFYLRGDETVAVTTIGADPCSATVAELLRRGEMPEASLIQRLCSDGLGAVMATLAARARAATT